jgi:hypothetical protein
MFSISLYRPPSICLEHKRMSNVCDRHLIRVKSATENQYVSLRSVISTVIHRQGWKVEQISFITGTRSVDKQDLNKNLKFFRVPEGSINSIYSKLVMRVLDVYANTLNTCISSDSTGEQQGRRPPKMPNRPSLWSPPSLTP